jgi:V/A-type H+-transporting ATPase subunit I
MSLMPMQKIAIFFPRGEREHLLGMLQEKGSVQILDLKETPLADHVETQDAAAGGEADRIAGDIKRAIEDVAEFEEKGGLLAGLGGGRVLVGEEQFKGIARDFDFEAVVGQVGDLEAGRTELRTRRNHLEAFVERLEPWAALDVPLEEISARKDIEILAGAISGGRGTAALDETLAASDPSAWVEVVSETERRTYIVVFYHKTDAEEVQEALRRSDFDLHTFEGLRGLPRDLLAGARREIASIDADLEDLISKGRELVRHRPHLMIAYDYFVQEARRAAAQGLVGNTGRVGIIEGWIRARDYEKLAGDVEARIEAAYVIKIEPEPGEEPPIELRNPPAMRPFEVLTEMYGMPHAREIDPTPLAGPFFALFFGFCITDAGYGIVLVVLSLLLMKYLHAGRKILWLAFIGGLTTILMGSITGGWFGLNDSTIPQWLSFVGTFRRKLMQFDPLEQPMTMFGLALALGVIQVTFGVFVKMIDNIRHGDIMAGIFDQLTWIVLLWSAVLYGLVRMGALSATHLPAIKWTAVGAAAGMIGFTNRKSWNPALRAGSGLYRLYQIATSSLGDILSYARLLALGMATGGIAMVINVVALIAKDIPIIGIPAMIFVLAAGHSFNIAVNALGGFVHSARLQYVEFYPKFFEGGGSPFRPFKRDLTYTRLIEDKAT